MTSEDKAINELGERIKEYRHLPDLQDGAKLNYLLQQITGILHYLEGLRSKYHEQWHSVVNREVLAGTSVARAENIAHQQVPQLYQFRRLMDSAYEVSGAIRTNISYLKAEMSNLN